MSNYFTFKATAAAGSGGYFSTGTIIPWTTATQADLPGFLICNGTAVSRSTYADLFAVIATTYGAGDGSSTFNLPNFQQKTMVGQDGNTNYAIGDSGGNTTSTPNVVFGSSTVNVTSNDNFAVAVNIAAANVAIPAHTHFVAFDNASFNNAASDVTANNTLAQVRQIGGNIPGGGNYDLAGEASPADVGLTSTTGSGSGSHNHTVNSSFNGSVTSSFNQSNISANANAVNILQPYQTVTFMIKT
tara:strand:+ start:4721 stop:5452 length:732 start_codon:yes stop_codon:yes gene_type:complete